VLAGAARGFARLLRAGDDPRAALASLAESLDFYRTMRVAFGLRFLIRDFAPAFAALDDHLMVATIDGAGALPTLRPLLVASAIERAREALGSAYGPASEGGRAMSDEELERCLLDHLELHLR
jgi:hypothetical protein